MGAADEAQKRLPDEYSAAVARLRADRAHGASWLAREAARALAGVATGAGTPEERLLWAQTLGRELAVARPSMAAIANTVAHIWWAATSPEEPQARLDALHVAASEVDSHWDAALVGMTRWARRVLADANGAIYTLSRSGSVEGTLTALARAQAHGEPLRVIVSESRPGAEGVELARALAAAGAKVTLAGDAACAALMDEAALVIVGADSVRADGSVVNKVGTHALALVARASGKPVYALAESLKVTPSSYPLVIEEMAPDEMLAEAAPGLTVRNIYFDVTPPDLITSVVAESGPLDADAIARLAEQAERAYQALMHS